MKQLTYRASVGGRPLVVRYSTEGFQTTDPTEAMADDPPRSEGAAGAHAWTAVVGAWRRRQDRAIPWDREVVRDAVGEARRAFAEGAAGHHRAAIHVFQDAATRRAEERYPPPARTDGPPTVPPSLRGAVVHPPQRP
ncbi:hypothetical protein AB0L40_11620 [Patulibacter sp. NPDC049589]|uniref:hypothetical protein n=1 Tax=Patulibacter sp. NPDC049589 TaxID=3154731 RepID=UPI003449532C